MVQESCQAPTYLSLESLLEPRRSFPLTPHHQTRKILYQARTTKTSLGIFIYSLKPNKRGESFKSENPTKPCWLLLRKKGRNDIVVEKKKKKNDSPKEEETNNRLRSCTRPSASLKYNDSRFADVSGSIISPVSCSFRCAQRIIRYR